MPCFGCCVSRRAALARTFDTASMRRIKSSSALSGSACSSASSCDIRSEGSAAAAVEAAGSTIYLAPGLRSARRSANSF